MDINILYTYVYDLNLYVCICVWSSKGIYEIFPGYDYYDPVLRGRGEDGPPSEPVCFVDLLFLSWVDRHRIQHITWKSSCFIFLVICVF